MNKIYKVIWSKAKHTYVVASEIAKGHTKGETTGRGLKKLAAALLVAAALLSPSFAWAADTVTVEPAGTGSTTTVEVYTKGGADSTFATKGSLTTEATERANVDSTLQTNIDNEVTNRKAADSTLQTNIDNEATNRKAADSTLQTNIDNEATNRKAADTTLQSNIDTEATDRKNADKTIQQAVDAKANAADVYSKTETDNKLADKANAADVYSKTNTDTKLADKANVADVYSKTDTDTKLADKANAADVYSKTDTDTKLADKANTADVYSKTDTDAKFATNDQLQKDVAATNLELANKADKATTLSGYGITNAYTKDEVDEADTKLQKSIDEEARKRKYSVTNLENADKQLQTNIDNEAAAREAEDTRLNSEIVKTNTSLNEAASNLSKLNDTVAKGFEDLRTEDKTLQTNINNEAAAREAADTALEKKVNKNTSDISGMQSDSKVSEDGSYVKTTNTVGENLTALDTGLQAEVTVREDADNKLQSAIDEEARKRKYSVTNLEKADKQLQTNIDNEAAARKAADTKLVEAVNSGLSLSNDNVLQKNTTSVGENGTVTTSKEAATTLVMNKGGDNQITLSDKGIKVGLNSGVMDKDGFYAGGDTADAAKAALKADGSIKGADGKFTVDADGKVTAASGKIGNVEISSTGAVSGVTDMTASGTITGNKLTDGVASLQNGNLTTTGNINAHAIVATGDISGKAITGTSLNTQGGDINGGAITGTTITGTTGTFGSLTTTGNASVGGTLSSNGLTNTGNATTDTLKVNHNATVGGDLAVTGDITGKSLNVGTGAISGGQITGTGLNVGAGTIKTTGAVETGTLETTGKAEIGGNLGVKGNLSVEGEFNAKTLSSKLDENNYTTINGGKTESMNLKMDKKTGEFQASGSTFDETGSNAWASDNDSKGLSTVTADSVKQSISVVDDNAKNYASRELSQNMDNKYEITDSVVEGNQSNVENRTADTTDSQISFKDDSGKVLNKSYITQNLKKVLMGVEEGDNKTTIEQDANNIINTAKNGTITNDAGKLVNTASESVTTQIGDGSEVQSVMNGDGIANKATGKSITNDAATITNTGTTSVTNQVGNNKVLVDTTHVQSAFGDTIYTTWDESGITNNATDKTVATNAKNIQNTATGDISNIASNGTISNEAKTISNKADEALTNDAKTITNKASESVTTQIGDGSEVQSVMNGDGIANKATGKSITNDAATITNTGTTSVTNQVGNNKVLVDTTHVQSAFGDTIYTTWDESGITNNATDKTVATNAKNIQNTATGDITNTASTGTITNDAKTLLNKASDSIIDKVGANVERTMTTKKISESVKDGDGTKSNSNTFTKTAKKDINIITDGTNTSTLSQLADSVNTSLKNGTQSLNNTKTVTEDVTKVTDENTGAFSSSSQKADAMTNTVKNGSKSNTVTETASTSEQKLVSGNIIDILKDAENGYVNTTVSNSDGSSSTGVKQTYTDITSTAKQGTITNDAKNLVNKAEEKLSNSAAEIENTATTSIKDTVGKSTVTTTTDGTTFENTDHNVAIGYGSITKTTISGNTLETGKATMDYAEVMKDLRVGGTTTTEDLHVTNNATIDGTLDVTGAANFQNKVTVAKDLSVGGDVTADSYKVGDKTYIDKDGINANNQVIRNVGQGDISEGSTDAVSGGQLYETNTRVSGLETRMGTVETRVDKLDNKIDKVGANAAAMANLHPLEFDEDSKWNVAAAVGSSGSETASAVGVFYRPNENVMVNASAAMGTGENMFGGGVSLRLGHGGNKAKEAQMKAAAAENKELRAKVDDLTARMDALLSVLNPNMSKDFPDVPENHWAYEAVSRLAGNGIVEGYEDGKYHGERQMTRYEMAEIIYNALSKGAKAEKKLVEEFRPELQAMAAQKKA